MGSRKQCSAFRVISSEFSLETKSSRYCCILSSSVFSCSKYCSLCSWQDHCQQQYRSELCIPVRWSLVLYIPSNLFSTRSFTYGCSFAFNFCVALRIVITDTADWALNVNNISVCVALRTVDTVVTDTADWALNINNICVCVARAKADLSHAVGLGSEVMIVVYGVVGGGGLLLISCLQFGSLTIRRNGGRTSNGRLASG